MPEIKRFGSSNFDAGFQLPEFDVPEGYDSVWHELAVLAGKAAKRQGFELPEDYEDSNGRLLSLPAFLEHGVEALLKHYMIEVELHKRPLKAERIKRAKAISSKASALLKAAGVDRSIDGQLSLHSDLFGSVARDYLEREFGSETAGTTDFLSILRQAFHGVDLIERTYAYVASQENDNSADKLRQATVGRYGREEPMAIKVHDPERKLVHRLLNFWHHRIGLYPSFSIDPHSNETNGPLIEFLTRCLGPFGVSMDFGHQIERYRQSEGLGKR